MAYDQITTQFAALIGVSSGTALVLLVTISIWSLIWKGLALWKSAKKQHMIWFIVFLINPFTVITLGGLEILYIYVFSKMGRKKKSKEEKPKPEKKK